MTDRTSPFAETLPTPSTRGQQSTLAPGAMVGRYRIEELIGCGGMGAVYRAYDPDIDRHVALKMIPLHEGDPDQRSRVLREAKAMARVAHPDVITVHDVGSHGDSIFIAMELVAGGTLREWLEAKRRTTPEILGVFLRAGRALARAHEVGLVHRDFKPDNVLVGDDGRVRVTDFGLARATRGGEGQAGRAADGGAGEGGAPPDDAPVPSVAATMEGLIVGTPAYMAPEQLLGARATARSDIFSFSVALWEALHGVRPFPGTTLAGLAVAIREQRIAPSESPPALAPLRRALLPGLAADPAKRCGKMEELIVALERASRPPLLSRVLPPLLAIVALALAFGASWRDRDDRRGPFSPGRRATLAVLPPASSAATESAWMGSAIAEVAWVSLTDDGRLRTASPDDVARARREVEPAAGSAGRGDADLASPAALQRFGDVLGVEYLLAGDWSISGAGDDRRLGIDFRLLRAKDGRLVASSHASGRVRELAEVTLEALEELKARAGAGRARPGDPATLRASLTGEQPSIELYVRGLDRLRAQDPKAAVQLLTDAAAADPASARVHAALARALADLGRVDAAQSEARLALEHSAALPRNEGLAIEALSHELLSEWDKAIPIAEALSRFYPDDLDYAVQLARLSQKAGKINKALRVIADMRSLPPPDSQDLRIDLAEIDVEEARSGYARALSIAHAAEPKAEALGSRRLMATVVLDEASAEVEIGHNDDALAHAQQAASLFAAVGDPLGEATAWQLSGRIKADRGDLEGAEGAIREARRLYEQLGNDVRVLGSDSNLAIIERRHDHLAAARARGEQILAEEEAKGMPVIQRSKVEENLGLVLWDLGELTLARAHMESSLKARRGIQDRRGEISALGSLTLVLHESGLDDEAEKDAARAHELAASLGLPFLQGIAGRGRGRIALDAGRAADAADALTEACEVVRKSGETVELAPCIAWLARAHAALGNAGLALTEADEATAMLADHFSHAGAKREVRTEVALARAFADPKAIDGALAEIHAVASEADAVGAVTARYAAELGAGLVLMRAHRDREGRAALTKLADEAQARGFVSVAAQARRATSRSP